MPSLAELARDTVVNVRIAMSRTLSKCPGESSGIGSSSIGSKETQDSSSIFLRLNRCPTPNMPDWVMELPDIRRAIRQLAQDSNSDVRHFVSFLPPILGADTSQEEKVFICLLYPLREKGLEDFVDVQEREKYLSKLLSECF